jgi:hypothetical protein
MGSSAAPADAIAGDRTRTRGGSRTGHGQSVPFDRRRRGAVVAHLLLFQQRRRGAERRALAGYAVLRRPTPTRALPTALPSGGHCDGDAVCAACVLWSLGQTGAGPQHDTAPRFALRAVERGRLSIILRWPVLCFCAILLVCRTLLTPPGLPHSARCCLAFGTAYLGLKT